MKRLCLLSIFLASALVSTYAQKADRIRDYDFKAALVEYKDSLSSGCDSLKYSEAVKKAENGLEMAKFCHKPKVVARKRFGAADFFLFYPLIDKTWHPTQRPGIYVCEPKEAGDTVRIPYSDSLEYFPFISGNEKYFSSKDKPGVGGYDLYVSRWDEKKKKWGPAENLGFPYSSPYDDFLFMNTEDGKYSIFASNRACSADSVCVYVVEYDPVMVRTEISEPSELKSLCSLNLADKAGIQNNSSAGKISSAPDESTKRYIEKIAHIRRLRDTISINAKRLESLRDSYNSSTEEDKKKLAPKIAEEEQKETLLHSKMERESRVLRNIEMDFLMNGIAIDIDKLIAESNQVIAVSETGFTFTKQELGKPVFLEYFK